MANVVASGLFGDGAAAVVMVGDARLQQLGCHGVQVRDSLAHFFPDTERVMGWDVGASGMRVVLSPTVPDLVARELRPVVDTLLTRNGLTPLTSSTGWPTPAARRCSRRWRRRSGSTTRRRRLTWKSLRDVGNLSSASVLHVLEQTLLQAPAGSGRPGLLLAMGPGFCAELVLLEW